MPRAVDGQTQQAINTLQARIDADPEIQAILQQNRQQLAATRDRGGSARDYQHRVRNQIVNIAKRKGYIPRTGQYFINPNDGQLEPHGGWAGLSNATRLAIIAAAATGGTLALGAAGVGPASGLFGSGATGATGAGAAGGGASLGGLYAAPAAITSGGVSAGIGAGAGAGTLAASQIPGWAKAAMGGPAAIASQRASRVIPWGGAADAAEDYLGGRRPPNRDIGRDVVGGARQLSPLLQSAIAALSGLPALMANHGPSNEEKALLEEARQMQAMQRQRLERQNPLFDAVTRLAMSRLPGSVQQG